MYANTLLLKSQVIFIIIIILIIYIYHLYAVYLQIYTINKTRFYGTQCCSCSVFTVCATCNVISRVKHAVYFYVSTSHSVCALPSVAVF